MLDEGWRNFAALLMSRAWVDSGSRHFWGPLFPFLTGKSVEEWIAGVYDDGCELDTELMNWGQ